MTTITKSAFSVGAISELLHHRVDLPQHAYACKTVHNAIVLPGGAVARRPGTRVVAPADPSSDEPSSLKLFRFALTDEYVLEFSELLIRVYKDTIWQADIVSPYTAAEGFDVNLAQLNDVVYMAHPAHNIKLLTRSSDTAWAITDYTTGTPGRDTTNATATTVATAGDGGFPIQYTLTSSAAVFDSVEIGNRFFVYWDDGSSPYWREFIISGINSSTSATAYLLNFSEGPVFQPVLPATTVWAYQIDAFDFGGNPATVFFYQDRLGVAATIGKPKTLFLSKTGIYDEFSESVPLVDSDGMELQITEGADGSPLYWAVSLKYLVANVGSSVVWLSSASGSGAITPTSKQASVGTYSSFSPVDPARVKNELVAVGSDNKSVLAIGVNTSTDEFPVSDLTALYPDLFADDSIKQVTFQEKPWPILWALTESGKLRGLSYDRELQMSAWHTHELGEDPENPAVIDSILFVPTTSGGELWMTVTRGTVFQFIERIQFTRDTTDPSQFFTDWQPAGLGFAYETEITPLLPAFQDNGGLTDGDDLRIERVSLSLMASPELTIETGAGSVTYIPPSDPFRGNTDQINLRNSIDDDTSVAIKTSKDAPLVLTAVRYEMEVR